MAIQSKSKKAKDINNAASEANLSIRDRDGSIKKLLDDTIKNLSHRVVNRSQLVKEAIIKHCHELLSES